MGPPRSVVGKLSLPAMANVGPAAAARVPLVVGMGELQQIHQTVMG